MEQGGSSSQNGGSTQQNGGQKTQVALPGQMLPEEAVKAAREAPEAKLREEREADGIHEEVTEEVFANYINSSVAVGHDHPGDICESGLLASVSLPPLTYPHDGLPSAVITNNLLSKLQLEGVLFACQKHQKLLPNGQRAGFFIGDGAGVGKGRQIAGIILDNCARGRMKHVWCSISSDLRLDAERDLKDIGCYLPVIDGCKELDVSSSKALGCSVKTGVLFSTYATLSKGHAPGTVTGDPVTGSSSKKRSRMQQIVDWCGGKDFDGCIIFDEAHKAKNFNSAKEEASTKVSQAVIDILEVMPQARAVYCSATGVTEIGHMAYACRLGLWGTQTPFPTFAAFKESMEARGLGALEMLAMELKASGSYVSRGLSWKGAEFSIEECNLPKQHEDGYNNACYFWKDVRKSLETAIGLTGVSGMCSKEKCKNGHVCNPMTAFWGIGMRFFRELANAAKVEAISKMVKEDVEAGYSVVIGLQSTGEAGMDKAMEELRKKPGDNVHELVSSAKYAAQAFITNNFPIRSGPPPPAPAEDDLITEAQRRNMTPEETQMFVAQSRAEAFAKIHSYGSDDAIPQCVAMKESLLARLRDLWLPPAPLDALVDALGGPQEVAEMTGRRARIARCARTGHLRYELRPEGKEESENVREKTAFMEGKKKVAIISDAASTGISLHAAIGSKAANRRRIHLTLELAWSADKMIQQLGRTHRSHQESAPIYKLLLTNLGGEKRYASAVAKRLMSLGALTKGDRRAATGADMSSFDLENKYGRSALKTMLGAASSGSYLAPGVDIEKLTPFLSAETAEAAEVLEVSNYTPSAGIAGLGNQERSPLYYAVLAEAKECVKDMALESKNFGKVSMFLNRLQTLPILSQNLMFAYFSERFRVEVEEARANGTFDCGVADLVAASVKLQDDEVLATNPHTGASTRLQTVILDRGVTFESAYQTVKDTVEAGGHAAFYRSYHTDKTTNRRLVLMAVKRKGGGMPRYTVTRPSTGVSPINMEAESLQSKYNKLGVDSMDMVKREWDLAYANSETRTRGNRLTEVALLSNSVLPVWGAVEKTARETRFAMTKSENALKVYRVSLDSGLKLVGVRLPTVIIVELKKNLAELQNNMILQVTTGQISPSQLVTPVVPACLKKVTTAPKTMLSFFSAIPKADQPEASGISSPPAMAPVSSAKQPTKAPVNSSTLSSAGTSKKRKETASGGGKSNNSSKSSKSVPQGGGMESFVTKKQKTTVEKSIVVSETVVAAQVIEMDEVMDLVSD